MVVMYNSIDNNDINNNNNNDSDKNIIHRVCEGLDIRAQNKPLVSVF